MHTSRMAVAGPLVLTPTVHADDRGAFLEWFTAESLTSATGHGFSLAQANQSVSRRGVLRGVHYADVPPGQAKYVTCMAGAVLDVAVDLRVGSPTFGQWDSVVLDTVGRRAVYLPVGFGHAFLALEDGSTVTYLCSSAYDPARERGIAPLDPDLAITWPTDLEILLSPKDTAAPALAAAVASGHLPTYEACLAAEAGS